MSAFYVGFDHINAILTAAWKSNVRFTLDKRHHNLDSDVLNYQILGVHLAMANVESLAARYPSSWNEMIPEGQAPHQFEFTPDPHASRMEPIALIKLTHCYDYQCCEVFDYDSSVAAGVMRDIRDFAIHKTPGYNDAPWAYEKGRAATRVPSEA